MLRSLFLLLTLSIPALAGGPYYIDYANGSNANNGTSTVTPWQTAPWMQAACSTTGTTFPGYSHAAGEQMIFRGGQVWPHTCFTATKTLGGAAGSPDIIGGDNSWYNASGTRYVAGVATANCPSYCNPIFDAQSSILGANNVMLDLQQNYITVQYLTIPNFYWDSTVKLSSQSLGIKFNAKSNMTVSHVLFTAWTHGTAASGTVDNFKAITGNTAAPYNPNSVVDSVECDGRPSGTDSGTCVFYGPDTLSNNKFHDMRNGYVGNPLDMHGNEGYNFNVAFDGSHGNFLEGLSRGCLMHDNYVHDVTLSIPLIQCSPPSGTTAYVYNNLAINISAVAPISVDSQSDVSGTAIVYVFNNSADTSSSSSSVSIAVGRPGSTNKFATLHVFNNQCIQPVSKQSTCVQQSSSQPNLVEDHELIQTSAAAIAAGYTTANLLQPTLVSSPTVATGSNFYSTCATCAIDRLGVTRPTVAAWDIGSYQWPGIAPWPVTLTATGSSANGTIVDSPQSAFGCVCTAGACVDQSGSFKCTANVSDGASVTFHAAATSGSFSGWQDIKCASFGTSDCTLTVHSPLSLQASFSLSATVSASLSVGSCDVLQGCNPNISVTTANLNVVSGAWWCEDITNAIITDTSTGLAAYCQYGNANALCGDGLHPSGTFTVHAHISDFSIYGQSAQCFATAGGQQVNTSVIPLLFNGRNATTITKGSLTK